MDKRSIFFVALLALSLYLVNWWFSSKEPEVKPSPPAALETVQEEARPAPPFVPSAPSSYEKAKEEYYVLENEYQQLVFSSTGGALVEINLPLVSKENQKSVIRSIRFDNLLKENDPQNDRFPSVEHFIPSPTEGEPLLKPSGQVGGYYPLLRRSLLSPSGSTLGRISPKYYALNLLSDEPHLATLPYVVKRFSKNLIEFEATELQRRVTKTFSLPKDPTLAPYTFELTLKVEGDARGLSLSSGIPEVELISGSASPFLKYRYLKQQKSQIESIKLPKNVLSFSTAQPDWICNSNGFFGLILNPLDETANGLTATFVPGDRAPTRLTLIDAAYNLYPASKYPGYLMELPLKKSGQTVRYRIFAGPFDQEVLNRLDQTFADPSTGYTPDYSSVQSFDRWFGFISDPFSKFLFFLMKGFYQVTHSWGISIILLTVALRIMLYPLNAWSFKSMSKMQLIAPKVAAMQERFKKDPKRSQAEVMTLYRENRVNPLTGCLPLLIQLPFLMGMFDLLKSTFALRGASFIPGWINNLTDPDILFSWRYPVFFIGTSFHLLPVLLGAIMFLQQKLSQGVSKNTSPITDQQKQQKMTGNIMVIVFTVLFYHFPSGLNIYWLSSMLLGILQQWYTQKRMVHAGVGSISK